MRILVTGSAGFIGSHVARRLLEQGFDVHGLDIVNDYYDARLKEARLAMLREHASFHEYRVALEDRHALHQVFSQIAPQRVIHLAAQAGVRYSLEHPETYIDSNLVGFANILELCRHAEVDHLVYASSSSVYGANAVLPFAPTHSVEHPISLYAATKKSNELMAHSYSYLFGLPCTGLRFFTVYGPWGRPDMALFKFTKAILDDQPIQIFNFGKHRRAFTYIDDVVEGVLRISEQPAASDPQWRGDAPDPSRSSAPYRIFNIGSDQSVPLMRYIEVLEDKLGREARKEYLPLQPGDVPDTSADIDDLRSAVGYYPRTPIEEGVSRFVDWYLDFYRNRAEE